MSSPGVAEARTARRDARVTPAFGVTPPRTIRARQTAGEVVRGEASDASEEEDADYRNSWLADADGEPEEMGGGIPHGDARQGVGRRAPGWEDESFSRRRFAGDPSADPNASPPAPNRVSVSPFEQRRRQALLEKQRRFAEMIGRIRAPDSPEQPPPPPRADPVATATTTPRRRTRILPRDEDETDPAPAAAAVDVSTDSDAWTPVSRRDHRQSGESPVVDSWDEIEAPAVTPPGARRRRPPGDDPSSPSSSLMCTPAE